MVANERLEKARIGVEEWERREDEWQKRTSSMLALGYTIRYNTNMSRQPSYELAGLLH